MTIRETYLDSIITISFLLGNIGYGLVVRPLLWQQSPLALEVIFLLSAVMAITYLILVKKIAWQTIQTSITVKLAKALPTILLLFAIGILIGSWMISGTIPLLVSYGLTLISVDHIYLIAFIVPIFFSMCTGTSWGSIATIGLVLITVATVIGADLAITTGAIVGGAYFGDKLSPLSDTTNIAAIAVNIDVYQHIYSMLVTTIPSAIIAAMGFSILDYLYPAALLTPDSPLASIELLNTTLLAIDKLYQLNNLLLVPPLIILFGAFKRYPALPTLICSSIVACVLAMIFQAVTGSDIFQTLYQGFNISMISDNQPLTQLPTAITPLFNRGGLYALNAPIIIIILVFIYLGALDCIHAIPRLINGLLGKISSAAALVSTTLVASAIVNSLTSSQYANSFVVGEAFRQKYDQLSLPRKVLSRSLEDTGTMIESLVPWSTTSVFIYASLHVSVYEYWPWQLLSLTNIVIAFIFAWCGIGYFKSSQQKDAIYEQ